MALQVGAEPDTGSEVPGCAKTAGPTNSSSPFDLRKTAQYKSPTNHPPLTYRPAVLLPWLYASSVGCHRPRWRGCPTPTINPQRLLDRLKTLRTFGAVGTGVVRPSLSPVDMEARRWLGAQIREAGLAAHIDGVAWVDEEGEVIAGPKTVWTIGRVSCSPGAPSLIPGEAEMILPYRPARPGCLGPHAQRSRSRSYGAQRPSALRHGVCAEP